MTDQRSNNEFDSLEAFFNERLKDASFAKPEEPWQHIEAELELMEKQKRRRRFLWFFSSGLLLIGGLTSLWFFVLSDKFNSKNDTQKQNTVPAQNKTAEKNSSGSIVAANTNDNSATEKESTNTSEKTNEETTKNSNTIAATVSTEKTVANGSMIQLAACTKKANPAIFNKVPFKIVEVPGSDGYLRYFAQTPVTAEALNEIHNAGFEKAFVKKNFQPAGEALVVKEEGMIETSSPVYVASTRVNPIANESVANNTAKENTENKNTHAIKNTAPVKEEPTHVGVVKDQSSTTQPGSIAVNEKKEEPAKTNSASTGGSGYNTQNTKTNTPVVNNSNNNAGATNTTVASQANTTAETNPQQTPPAEAKKDSVPPEPVVAVVTKDSVVKKQEPDTAKNANAYLPPAPFTPEWAILLLAGPNIFNDAATSNLYLASNESKPVTLNTEAKIQFRPFKKFSFLAGFNYMQIRTSQARTMFLFNKNRQEDYILYNSFGAMAVPMSTLLEGYSAQVPFDTFPCYYTQNSKLNLVNIPIEMNFHFFNKNRVNLTLGIGANSMFALSQQTELVLHKENFDNNLSYNSVTVNKFNLSLMFSLGCDIRLYKSLYLTVAPSYRYGLTNMSAQSGTSLSPSYFSANAGLKFKF